MKKSLNPYIVGIIIALIATFALVFVSNTLAHQIPNNDLRIIKKLEKYGFSPKQAIAIVANLMRESELNHKANGDNGIAYGLAQWHPDRQKSFKQVFGISMTQSSEDLQLRFIAHELKNGAESQSWKKIQHIQDLKILTQQISNLYLRPKNKSLEARERIKLAMALEKKVQQEKKFDYLLKS